MDSIRANGVLTPILGWRDQDGNVNVRAGQRRTLAAREAGLATVPVYVVDAADTDTAQRIVAQIVENDQREAITDTDRIEAWRQLELAGLTATAIAKRTGAKRDRIKTGLAVAASDTGTTLVGEVGLTLDQAASLLEFDDDRDTVAALVEYATAQPDYFPVAVQRARNERTATATRERVAQEHTAKGHRILNERPGWNGAPYRLRMLTTADGGEVTEEAIDGKPGVAVHIATSYDGEARVEYFVDDPDAAGVTVREDVTLTAAPEPHSGPMTDEQKAERKALIAHNKEWDAAETVRREWLASFLGRKTLPKDATAVVAASLTHGGRLVSDAMTRGGSVAKTLLGLTDGYETRLGDYLDEHPTRALHVALAVTLGGIEQNTSRESWRNPRPDTARYFRTLAGWGYPLTPVEQIAAQITDDQ